jgi:septal ring factor EnvC (AmiA/AmiB activator)
MFRNTALALLALGFAAAAAHADMYRCEVPGTNSPLYTNDARDTQGKKCTVLSREINIVPAQPKGAAKASRSFPTESSSARASAKDRQRDILEKELAGEEDMLEKAQKALSEQEEVRYGNERNYARVQDRLKPFKDNVELHQKNIDTLRQELNDLYR